MSYLGTVNDMHSYTIESDANSRMWVARNPVDGGNTYTIASCFLCLVLCCCDEERNNRADVLCMGCFG